MRYIKKFILLLLIAIVFVGAAKPAILTRAAVKTGIIIGDKAKNYKLYNNLTVVSPENNIMIKVNNALSELGLTYIYDKTKNSLTVKNPDNDKTLVFILNSRNYYYYSDAAAKAVKKTAANKFYYDKATGSYLIYFSTLKYIVYYNYYKDVRNQPYGELGYQSLAVYSRNDYVSYDLPVTEELLAYVNSRTFTSKEKLLDAVRLNLMARNTGVTFTTNRKVMNELKNTETIFDTVKTLDNRNTSKDADYLSLLIDQFGQSWRSTSTRLTYPDGRVKSIESDNDKATLTINIDYETTLTQERAVDCRVAKILKELKLAGASDYDKVKKIHDYIINFASYDTTYQKSSAYDLLFNKTAVCEGYTLAAYRLFTDAGLDCRIISGKGDGEAHSWNIVKVDGQWYNIDLTWDDPITVSGKQVLNYDYFLKNDTDFDRHQRSSKFNTPEFESAYPIAAKSYSLLSE